MVDGACDYFDHRTVLNIIHRIFRTLIGTLHLPDSFFFNNISIMLTFNHSPGTILQQEIDSMNEFETNIDSILTNTLDVFTVSLNGQVYRYSSVL